MSKGKILVIDDEDIVVISCKRALEPEGYEVKTVKSGVEGLKIVENEDFDVVITDLKMPEVDGIEVLRLLKEKNPAVEVVIITGYQTVETAVKAIKFNAFDYVEKPFTPEQMLSVIKNALAHKANR